MGETEDERAETPAEASRSAKGDLSYHYWHARANAGDAPAATAKVRRDSIEARGDGCALGAKTDDGGRSRRVARRK